MAELIGLQKYFKGDVQRYVDGAISMINYADRYNKCILTKRGWNLLKDLICDPEINDVMDVINKTYQEYIDMVKKGLTSADEQKIVYQQISNCNKMLKDAVNELISEGRLKVSDKEMQNNKLYSIKQQENDMSLELK